MSYGLNDDEALLVKTVRAFVDRDVAPSVQEVEHPDEYPEKWIEQMKQIGIYGLAIPEEYGGSPVSMPCYVAVTEELARGWMSLAGAMGGHTVVAKLISTFGTEEQRQRCLPVMAIDGARTKSHRCSAQRSREHRTLGCRRRRHGVQLGGPQGADGATTTGRDDRHRAPRPPTELERNRALPPPISTKGSS